MFQPIVPLSGVQGLRYLDNTLDAQQEALETDEEVVREVTYFRENVGSITDSEGLLADRRLLEVALTAYGLESEIDNTAFIKRVLDEGTQQEGAFANRLNDARWVDFSRAFGFGDTGSGLEIPPFQAAVELRFRGDGRPAPGANALPQTQIDAFRIGVNKIASVDDLLKDVDTLNTAMAAYGLERGFYTDQHFVDLLTEGTGAGSYAASLDNAAWLEFAKAFTGLADGEAPLFVSTFQLDVARELERRDRSPISNQITADADPTLVSETQFDAFASALSAATTVDEALANDDFLAVARVAYGLEDATVTDAEARAILSAGAQGDFSLADRQSQTSWTAAATALGAAFDGGVKPQAWGAQYSIERNLAAKDLEFIPSLAPEETPLPTVDAEELAYFRTQIASVEDAAALVADERLLDVALRAFGLENEGKSTSYIQSILEEDIYDTDNPAFSTLLSDTRWFELARAFQPPPPGTNEQPDIWRYSIEEKLIALEAPQEDIDYLRRNWNLIDTGLDLTLDPQLSDIVLSAFGVPKGTYTTTTAITALISDPTDKNSFVNVFGDQRLIEFSELFNGTQRGNTNLENFQTEVVDLYQTKLFEIGVGNQDDSLRIALNFRREIADIAANPNAADAGWFEVMGSPPLRAVMDAAFGLPAEFAQLDIDAQVPIYEARSSALFGGRDPSVFRDPLLVQRAIDRYLASTTQATNNTQSGFAALTLLNQTVSFARSINLTA